MKEPIRLLLADDHAVMRSGLANMLNIDPAFRVIGEANDGPKALQLYRQLKPDVLLLDVTMAGMDGIETLRRLRTEYPGARVVMLSSSEAEEDIVQSFEAGAAGYVTKTAQPEELSAAILAVHAGNRVMSPGVERRLSEHASGGALSLREVEVLNLLRQGMSNPDIARVLSITRHTVKAHVAAILVKLEATDRTEAVTRGFERGLLKP
jgi:DNA-binding NarL/FixJ family response regulator